MKKKIFLVLAVVAMLACVFAISASAAECIDDIYYTFSGTEATVSSDNQEKCEVETVVIPEKVIFNGTEYTVTAIATKAFGNGNANGGNSKIKSVTIPSTVTSIGDYAFANCANITTVNSYSTILGSYMFYNCPLVEYVALKNTVTISNHAFCNTLSTNSKNTNISSLVFPDTLESIGSYAFARCQITKIVIPANTSTIGANAFTDCDKLEKAVVLGTTLNTTVFNNCSVLDELVLTENIAYGHKDAIKDTAKNFTTYYTGSDPSVIKTLFAGTSRIDSAIAQPYNADSNYTGSIKIIYDVNLCVAAFDGVHTEPQDDGDCTTALICSVCADYKYKEAEEHTISERVTYASFLQDGEHYIGCTNDGCTYGISEKLNALFTCLGYSAPEDGRGGIAIGFTVNNEAIAEYEEITGKTLKYGVFAVLKDRLGNNDVFSEDGTVAEGAINADITSYEFALFELKIVGFTDEYKDIKLAMGAYVAVTDGETTEYSYLQSGTPNENEKYCFVSYNDIVGAPSNDEEVTQ